MEDRDREKLSRTPRRKDEKVRVLGKGAAGRRTGKTCDRKAGGRGVILSPHYQHQRRDSLWDPLPAKAQVHQAPAPLPSGPWLGLPLVITH